MNRKRRSRHGFHKQDVRWGHNSPAAAQHWGATCTSVWMTAEHVKGPFGHTTAVGQYVDSVPTSVVRRLTDTRAEQTACYQRSSIAVICVSAPVDSEPGLVGEAGRPCWAPKTEAAIWRRTEFKLATWTFGPNLVFMWKLWIASNSDLLRWHDKQQMVVKFSSN